MVKATDAETQGNEKSQEKTGIRTPERTPEDLGNMSNSEWMRRHSSDSKIEQKERE
jgi:hypothetical protein